jgi:WD40 repeat protein
MATLFLLAPSYSDKHNRTIRVLLALLSLAAMTPEIYSQVMLPECLKVTPVLVLRDGNSPSISADGKRIAVSPRIGLDEVYDVVSGRRLQSFRVRNSFGSQLSADGGELAIFAPSVSNDAFSRPCTVLFFDVDSGRQNRKSTNCVKHEGRFFSSLIIDNVNNNRNLSADLRLIAGPANHNPLDRRAASNQRGILLWDISQQRLVREFGEFRVYDEYNFDTWKEVRLTPDGRVLGATRFNRSSENLETVIWDTQSGRVLLRLPFASRHLALSDDGRRVATTRERPMASGNSSVSLAVNSKGQVVAGASADVNAERPPTEVWDVQTKERIAEVGEYSGRRVPITGLAFSPDGNLLATETLDCVLVWDVVTGRLRASLLHDEDRTDRVRSVSFSSNGKYMVTSSSNEVVKVWSVIELTKPE